MSFAICLLLIGQAPVPQIMSSRDLKTFRAYVPQVDDPVISAQLNDLDVMWYTDQEMPPAYQMSIGNGYVQTTFLHADANISSDDSERRIPDANGDLGGGNGNTEFPWNVAPGGAHRSPYVRSFKGLLLPPKEGGGRHPVIWFREDMQGRGARIISGNPRRPLPEGPRSPRGMNYGYGWLYPVGTVFFEVLTTVNPDRKDIPFELRVRTRESDAWGVDIFRPFATAQQMADAIKTGWPELTPRLQKAVDLLENPPVFKMARMTDTAHSKKRAFDVTAVISYLPPLGDSEVDWLLNRRFVSALGETWQTDPTGLKAIAPYNGDDRHGILPYRYHATFMGNDRDGCMNCHDSTGVHVARFQLPRGWYGFIRGRDGIFSWHPIDPSSISTDGGALQVRFRQSFLDAGIVEPYDPERHPQSLYSSIPGLN